MRCGVLPTRVAADIILPPLCPDAADGDVIARERVGADAVFMTDYTDRV